MWYYIEPQYSEHFDITYFFTISQLGALYWGSTALKKTRNIWWYQVNLWKQTWQVSNSKMSMRSEKIELWILY